MSNQTHPTPASNQLIGDLAVNNSRSVLTFSALNTFRNCPRKYKHRYIDFLRPRERAGALSFGSVVHGAIELWYQSPPEDCRLWSVLDFIDRQFPERLGDENQKSAWHLARAMITGYVDRYQSEDFSMVEVERTFTGEIRNPETGRPSQTFVIAGKADAIVEQHDGLYLLEHKTASSIVNSGNGVHLYWLLDRPFLIDDAGDPPPVETQWSVGTDGRKKPRRYIMDGKPARYKPMHQLQTFRRRKFPPLIIRHPCWSQTSHEPDRNGSSEPEWLSNGASLR